MKNDEASDIAPNFKIIFFNKYGFVTEMIAVHWLLSTIDPGETRIEEQNYRPLFGPASYYQIQFD